jgi:hypothetical protein
MLLYFVKNPIICFVHTCEKNASTSKGAPMPSPNMIKLRRLKKKSGSVKLLINRAAIKSGLQGITMAPKKKPKIKALR